MKTLLNNIKDRDYASENEKNVIDIFRKALEKHFNNEWTIIHNAFIPLINGEHMEIDLIIAKNNYPVAIVEIKPSLNNCRLPLIENQLHRAAVVLYAPLCIVCSPKEMLSCSANTGFDKNDIKVLNTENIRQVLAAADNNKNDNVTINKIKSKWEYILGSFDFETKKEVEQFITQIKECDVTNEPNSFYLNEEKEDLLFRKLLGEYKKDDLCRFTTMNSIFRTCNEKAQSMCCIICMNDKSETDYATQKLNLTIQNDSEEINGCYIMSCCDIESKNNFTMWRLYADDAKGYVLEDIDLHIKEGETIGILGATGSAKSTLVSLIPRLYDVTSGRVLVDGRDVKAYDLKALRKKIAIVLQKNLLFSGTIRENMLWGDDGASDQKIDEALKVAGAYDFVHSFKDGLDTYLEEGGVNVSGGQRQRLCIARALLKDPKILILDDSTSAVDMETERSIRKALSAITDMTKIIIAQRVVSVMEADKIVILDDGKIEAIGDHKTLLGKSLIYRDLYEVQMKGVQDAA